MWGSLEENNDKPFMFCCQEAIMDVFLESPGAGLHLEEILSLFLCFLSCFIRTCTELSEENTKFSQGHFRTLMFLSHGAPYLSQVP